MLHRLFAIVACLSFSCGWALAQSGRLEVRVLDGATEKPLAGATVVLNSNRGWIVETALVTDGEGLAVFPVLRTGEGYRLEVAMPGFAGYRVPDIRIRTNATERVSLALSQALEERISVTRGSDLVDLDRTGNTTTFSDSFIEGLPVEGRFYQNLLSLAPGVKDADKDGNPNVHGARTRDFKANVDGVSNVDPLTGGWLSFVHPDSIEELRMIPTGAGVEFSRAQGGFAEIVQKQGSNDFEGVFNYVYRSSDLDRDGAANLNTGLVPEFEWRQPSLQLSGPILRDRLWYRLSREEIDGTEPINLLGTVETTGRQQLNDSHQITWQASPRNKLAFRFQQSPLRIENVGLESTVPVASTHSLEMEGPTYSFSWIAPASARLLFDTLISYQDVSQSLAPTGINGQNCLSFGGTSFIRLNAARCLNTGSGFTSGTFPETTRDSRQRLTLTTHATYYLPSFLGVSHRIKLGFSIENERYFRRLERTPDLNFRVERQYLDPCPIGGSDGCFQDVGIATASISVPRASTSTATGVAMGVWVEDQIKLTDALTVTAGLRLDREETDSKGRQPFDPADEARAFAEGLAAGDSAATLARTVFTAFSDIQEFQDNLSRALGLNPESFLFPVGGTTAQSAFWPKNERRGDIHLTNTNLAPRLAVAWDPWRDGKTKISASWGRYYDKIVLAVPLVELEPATTTLVWSASDFMRPSFSAGPLIGGVNPTITVQRVDRDLRTPYQDELTFAFERSIAPETSVKLTYVRRDFEDQLQDADVNHATGDRGRCLINTQLGTTTVAQSDGEGFILIDPFTGEQYVDEDPGPGDGRIDDCTGDVEVTALSLDFPPEFGSRSVPDGLADLYVLNPGWGEILLVGNFNRSRYEAVVLELVRRMYRSWQMNASYTWSQARGDAEDFLQPLGNERNLVDEEYGFLSYDQRHAVKVNLVSQTPWGFRFGGTLGWESGLPYSNIETRLTSFSRPPEYLNLGDIDVKTRFRFPSRQRNDQRNPSFWTLDLRLAKVIVLRAGTLQLTAEVFNVFNDDTALVRSRLDGVNSGFRRFGRRYQLGLRWAF